jgi:hypothetical protein
MKLSFLAAPLLAAAAACAQSNPFYLPQPLAELKEFLQLSDRQVQAILANNEEYNVWAARKQARIAQVQSEIVEETAKDPLDSNALGMRYVEIETNCREMKQRAAEFRTRNLDALSQDQKAKLKVLDEAFKLLPLISQAQSGNLFGDLTYAPLYFSSGTRFSSTTGAVIGGYAARAYGCTSTLSSLILRTGDLTPLPPGNIIPPGRFTGAVPLPGNSTAARWFDPVQTPVNRE